MEYFKVIQKTNRSSIEVNRDEYGNFNFVIKRKDNVKWSISLSKTEAKDLMLFIGKRLSEKYPDEVEEPF